ncbi:hypothetical protein [Streptosporangium jomthongense]|uniref:Cell division protein FtsK n=1 Tax=Streptosporangium jomthongense TaxID=1193683 RepID=A0ABV8F3S4_9ACTN
MTLHHTPDPLPEDGDSMGELVRFPLRDGGEAEPLEGTVVPRALPDTSDGPAPLVRLLGQAVEHAVRLRDDERAVRLTRSALGVTVAIGQGGHSWLVRAWDALTLGAYRRQIRAAEAMGDRAALAEWMDRKQQAADRRHTRLAALPGLALGLAKVGAGGVAATGVVLLGTSTLVWATGAGEFLTVPTAAGTLLRWVFDAVAFGISPALTVAPVALVWAAWREGRRRGAPVSWLNTNADADVDVTIDETTIARALGSLRIPQINAYLKQGLPLQFLVTARRDGRGTYAEVRLPLGVTAEEICLPQKRAKLSAGLYRAVKETWPAVGGDAGILKLWVADKGALAEGAGPYPLLEDGFTDVFQGLPYGKTLRGDPIVVPFIGRNTLVGGLPDQGKSSAARVIMGGACLDPTAELRIWVPDANYDFEVFKRRCSRYVMGAEDEKIEQILYDLRELHAEVQKRGELLVQHREPEVTRKLASAGIGMHPIAALLEEAHVAFQHKEFGEEIAELAISIVKLGRKRGIHLIVSTQAPTKDSMPRDITRNCSNGIAFAVSDHVANDALLGQGAYRGGHRATELIVGVDKGTALVKGFSGQRSEMVQAHFLSVAEGNDQVTPLIDRVLAEIERLGTGIPGKGRPAPQVETARDLLEDLAAVLGSQTIRAADVPALLREHAPRWVPYRTLTGKQLVADLADLGIKVPSTGNQWKIPPELIQQALIQRQADDEETE